MIKLVADYSKGVEEVGNRIIQFPNFWHSESLLDFRVTDLHHTIYETVNKFELNRNRNWMVVNVSFDGKLLSVKIQRAADGWRCVSIEEMLTLEVENGIDTTNKLKLQEYQNKKDNNSWPVDEIQENYMNSLGLNINGTSISSRIVRDFTPYQVKGKIILKEPEEVIYSYSEEDLIPCDIENWRKSKSIIGKIRDFLFKIE